MMNAIQTLGVFPPALNPAVQDYKKMLNEYNKITDVELKAAYKRILDTKLVEIRAALQTYITSVTAAVNALEI